MSYHAQEKSHECVKNSGKDFACKASEANFPYHSPLLIPKGQGPSVLVSVKPQDLEGSKHQGLNCSFFEEEDENARRGCFDYVPEGKKAFDKSVKQAKASSIEKFQNKIGTYRSPNLRNIDFSDNHLVDPLVQNEYKTNQLGSHGSGFQVNGSSSDMRNVSAKLLHKEHMNGYKDLSAASRSKNVYVFEDEHNLHIQKSNTECYDEADKCELDDEGMGAHSRAIPPCFGNARVDIEPQWEQSSDEETIRNLNKQEYNIYISDNNTRIYDEAISLESCKDGDEGADDREVDPNNPEVIACHNELIRASNSERFDESYPCSNDQMDVKTDTEDNKSDSSQTFRSYETKNLKLFSPMLHTSSEFVSPNHSRDNKSSVSIDKTVAFDSLNHQSTIQGRGDGATKRLIRQQEGEMETARTKSYSNNSWNNKSLDSDESSKDCKKNDIETLHDSLRSIKSRNEHAWPGSNDGIERLKRVTLPQYHPVDHEYSYPLSYADMENEKYMQMKRRRMVKDGRKTAGVVMASEVPGHVDVKSIEEALFYINGVKVSSAGAGLECCQAEKIDKKTKKKSKKKSKTEKADIASSLSKVENPRKTDENSNKIEAESDSIESVLQSEAQSVDDGFSETSTMSAQNCDEFARMEVVGDKSDEVKVLSPTLTNDSMSISTATSDRLDSLMSDCIERQLNSNVSCCSGEVVNSKEVYDLVTEIEQVNREFSNMTTLNNSSNNYGNVFLQDESIGFEEEYNVDQNALAENFVTVQKKKKIAGKFKSSEKYPTRFKESFDGRTSFRRDFNRSSEETFKDNASNCVPVGCNARRGFEKRMPRVGDTFTRPALTVKPAENECIVTNSVGKIAARDANVVSYCSLVKKERRDENLMKSVENCEENKGSKPTSTSNASVCGGIAQASNSQAYHPATFEEIKLKKHVDRDNSAVENKLADINLNSDCDPAGFDKSCLEKSICTSNVESLISFSLGPIPTEEGSASSLTSCDASSNISIASDVHDSKIIHSEMLASGSDIRDSKSNHPETLASCSDVYDSKLIHSEAPASGTISTSAVQSSKNKSSVFLDTRNKETWSKEFCNVDISFGFDVDLVNRGPSQAETVDGRKSDEEKIEGSRPDSELRENNFELHQVMSSQPYVYLSQSGMVHPGLPNYHYQGQNQYHVQLGPFEYHFPSHYPVAPSFYPQMGNFYAAPYPPPNWVTAQSQLPNIKSTPVAKVSETCSDGSFLSQSNKSDSVLSSQESISRVERNVTSTNSSTIPRDPRIVSSNETVDVPGSTSLDTKPTGKTGCGDGSNGFKLSEAQKFLSDNFMKLCRDSTEPIKYYSPDDDEKS